MRLVSAPVLGAALATAGCATTMQTAARLQLNDARIRAAELPTRVQTPGHAVHVTAVTLLRHGDQVAFVVGIRNAADRPVSDLPISVGVRSGRHVRRVFNAGSTAAYFRSHLPAVAAGSQTSWVLTGDARLPAGARPFAVVGESPSAPARPRRSLPPMRVIRVPGVGGTASPQGPLTILVSNLSSIPQYQLQVYAIGRRSGRLVAAGALTVPVLAAGARVRVRLHLVGSSARTRLQLQAFPTIFR